jgi:hypothetical protein
MIKELRARGLADDQIVVELLRFGFTREDALEMLAAEDGTAA